MFKNIQKTKSEDPSHQMKKLTHTSYASANNAACMSIDAKFVRLTADVLRISFKKNALLSTRKISNAMSFIFTHIHPRG